MSLQDAIPRSDLKSKEGRLDLCFCVGLWTARKQREKKRRLYSSLLFFADKMCNAAIKALATKNEGGAFVHIVLGLFGVTSLPCCLPFVWLIGKLELPLPLHHDHEM